MKEKEAKRKKIEKAEKETEARLVIHARAKEGGKNKQQLKVL